VTVGAAGKIYAYPGAKSSYFCPFIFGVLRLIVCSVNATQPQPGAVDKGALPCPHKTTPYWPAGSTKKEPCPYKAALARLGLGTHSGRAYMRKQAHAGQQDNERPRPKPPDPSMHLVGIMHVHSYECRTVYYFSRAKHPAGRVARVPEMCHTCATIVSRCY
jgi:hypothetical protein